MLDLRSGLGLGVVRAIIWTNNAGGWNMEVMKKLQD